MVLDCLELPVGNSYRVLHVLPQGAADQALIPHITSFSKLFDFYCFYFGYRVYRPINYLRFEISRF